MNSTLAGPMLYASFAVTSLIGVAWLLAFWLPTDAASALVRSSLFVTVMAIVHLFGYRLYVRQSAPAVTSRNVDFSHVRPHLAIIVRSQLSCLVLTALLLDGGLGFRICVAAVFAHWLAIAFVSARDRDELGWIDVFAIRWGFFPCLACAVLTWSIRMGLSI